MASRNFLNSMARWRASRWLTEILRRPIRPLAAVAFLTLEPKCVVCALAYAGIGAVLGLCGPKICGVTVGSRGSWAPSLAVFGVARESSYCSQVLGSVETRVESTGVTRSFSF